MLAGDEVASAVVDLGSCTSKFGHAGNGNPTAVVTSFFGCYNEAVAPESKSTAPQSSKKYVVGDMAMNLPREGMEVKSLLMHGKVTDWDALESLWLHTFQNYLFVDPAERPVLVSDFIPEDHEKALELLFQKAGHPAAHLARAPALAAFSAGRRTALVVEVGAQTARASPVVDGYVLNQGVRATARGAGDWLDRRARALLAARGHDPLPRFLLRETRATPDSAPKRPNPKAFHSSYIELKKNEVARDIKESLCCIPDEPTEEEDRDRIRPGIQEQNYELPDGTTIKIQPDLITLPELMFKSQGSSKNRDTTGSNELTLPQIAYKALENSDGDARKEMAASILLCGGGSLFHGIAEKMGAEMTQLLPSSYRVRVINPTAEEKKFSTWIGGSILCSLGSFQQMWVSKQEYEEKGAHKLFEEERFEY